jgi:hypothetical protein
MGAEGEVAQVEAARSSFSAASPPAAARRRSFPLALHCKLNSPTTAESAFRSKMVTLTQGQARQAEFLALSK